MVLFPFILFCFFTVPSLHAFVFIQKTFLELVPAVLLLLLLLLFFVLLFRNCKREEAGGEAEGKMHGL